jgi:ubiquitin-conjugating enzyme E2 S
MTKIFHPNVDANGLICVNALKKDWKPTQGLRHTLAVIRCLLIQPNPESALNEEASRMLLENYDDYAARARLFTKIYAMPKIAEQATKPTTTEIVKKQKRSIKRL